MSDSCHVGMRNNCHALIFSDVSPGFQSQSGLPYSHSSRKHNGCFLRSISGSAPADLFDVLSDCCRVGGTDRGLACLIDKCHAVESDGCHAELLTIVSYYTLLHKSPDICSMFHDHSFFQD